MGRPSLKELHKYRENFRTAKFYRYIFIYTFAAMTSKTLKVIGQLIQAEMTRQGISKYRLAQDLKVRPPTLTKLIKGESCRSKILADVIEYLNLELTVRPK